MHIIRKPYQYFGHICRQCGCYFTYTLQDVEIGDLACPECKTAFRHSVDEVDCEPTVERLTLLATFSENCGMHLAEHPYMPGDEVFVAYDAFYAKAEKGVKPGHTWIAKEEPVKVKSVSYKYDENGESRDMTFDQVIFYANDPRQHCKEEFHGVKVFRTFAACQNFVTEKNKGK